MLMLKTAAKLILLRVQRPLLGVDCVRLPRNEWGVLGVSDGTPCRLFYQAKGTAVAGQSALQGLVANGVGRMLSRLPARGKLQCVRTDALY